MKEHRLYKQSTHESEIRKQFLDYPIMTSNQATEMLSLLCISSASLLSTLRNWSICPITCSPPMATIRSKAGDDYANNDKEAENPG